MTNELGNENGSHLTFMPEINERSREISEKLRKNSILELFDLISNGLEVVDLMSFQTTSAEVQNKMTRQQVLAVQYFIPYVMQHSKKLESEEIPLSVEKTLELIKMSYDDVPIMIDFDEKIFLYVTRNSFLETMKTYLKQPNGKKFPIPIKFDKKKSENSIGQNDKNGPAGEKKKKSGMKVTKVSVGPQMERAINNYLLKRRFDRNSDEGKEKDPLNTDPECTFQPNLQKTLYEKYRKQLGVNSLTRNDECMDMIKKYLLLDNNDKDEKVESYFKSLQECTFQPNVEKFVKKGIPVEYSSKLKKLDNENEVLEPKDQSREMVFFGSEKSELELDQERIQKQREKAINEIFQNEWSRSINFIFKEESKKRLSNLIPVTYLEPLEGSSSKRAVDSASKPIEKPRKDQPNYEWETREQGPILDRELRQRFKQARDGKTSKEDNSDNTKKKANGQEKQKKYSPPYKWEEDLRNSFKAFEALNPQKGSKANEQSSLQPLEKVRWERYIRLRERHVKSLPISNTDVIANPELGLDEDLGLTNITKCYSRICEIAAPVTVVGVREDVLNFLEEELRAPLPNLSELFGNAN
ncbi:hypothetical protein HWI79_1735 [Cryptosporidium felis]|nr:hypothetical protein HWI79_1735 [Cryptosporidium felis]